MFELESDAIRCDWSRRQPVVSRWRCVLVKATTAKDADVLIYARRLSAIRPRLLSLSNWEIESLAEACGRRRSLKCTWLWRYRNGDDTPSPLINSCASPPLATRRFRPPDGIEELAFKSCCRAPNWPHYQSTCPSKIQRGAAFSGRGACNPS